MTSTELRRIVGAMTERPWKHGSWQYDAGPPFRYVEIRPSGDEDVSITVDGPIPSNALDDVKNVIGGCGCCGSPFGRHEDGQAIVTLANHADALVALVEACEQEASVLASFAARNGASYANTAKAIERVLSALAAVHATKATP